MRSTATVVVVLLSVACGGGTPPQANSRDVASTDFPNAWPFTVSHGQLRCEPGNHVTFTTGGTTYAVNGSAKGYAKAGRTAWLDAAGISREQDFSSQLKSRVDRLAIGERRILFAHFVDCENEHNEGQGRNRCKRDAQRRYRVSDAEAKLITDEGLTLFWPPLTPLKMDVGPIIQAGLALCR